MYNFNHERWVITATMITLMRKVISESLKWVHQRLVFNKLLIKQPVIRYKLSEMVCNVESCQNMLDFVT